MKKSGFFVAILLLSILAGSMLVLRFYKLSLVQSVVVTALIQKAPTSYPQKEIHEAFQKAFLVAERQGQEQAYLEQLLQISQRLEKIQQLSQETVKQLLESLDSDEDKFF